MSSAHIKATLIDLLANQSSSLHCCTPTMPRTNVSRTPSFDAKALLNITPNRNHRDRFTCMGTTRRGRRCCNPRKESVADDTLSQIPGVAHDRDMLESTLDNLVFDVYCHLHRGQAPIPRWSQMIREEADKHRPLQRSTIRSVPIEPLEPSRNTGNVSGIACSSSCSKAVSTSTIVETPTQLESMNRRQESNANDTAEASEEDPCPICYRSFSEAGQACETACGHKFCFECIDTWLSSSRTCPLDRKPVHRGEVKLILPSRLTAVAGAVAISMCG